MLKTLVVILAAITLGAALVAGGMALYDLFVGRDQRYREMYREHLEQQRRVDEQLSESRSQFLNENDT